MPIVSHSSFRPHSWVKSPHLQTILPALFREADTVTSTRERLELNDGDFLDLDWKFNGSDCLAILSHGLEGSSQRSYIQGMAGALNSLGLDILAWNMRGCSGVPNRLLNWYHSGKSEDLRSVVEHVAGRYKSIVLIGFSVGGNITLKYLGEEGTRVFGNIKGAIAISVPIDLENSARIMESPSCTPYMLWFLHSLRNKIASKLPFFPQELSLEGFWKLRTFADFDERYTAPLNGFSSSEDYWRAASSLPLLDSIKIPTLLISAKDDPFFGSVCFPYEIARRSDSLFLETPETGGHVGFFSKSKPRYWLEERTLFFLRKLGICR